MKYIISSKDNKHSYEYESDEFPEKYLQDLLKSARDSTPGRLVVRDDKYIYVPIKRPMEINFHWHKYPL